MIKEITIEGEKNFLKSSVGGYKKILAKYSDEQVQKMNIIESYEFAATVAYSLLTVDSPTRKRYATIEQFIDAVDIEDLRDNEKLLVEMMNPLYRESVEEEEGDQGNLQATG